MKSKIINVAYLLLAIVGIWTLVGLWMPLGYALVGHDSGLALNAKNFLLTRLYAWDNRINFGLDNSPHFGSLIMHSIDYLLSTLGGTLYSGNQVTVFFWIATIFICAFILASAVESVAGRYFKFVFPVFVTFNFYIFQSIFVLERAKYELYCVLLIFLAIAFRLLKERKKPVLKYSIIFVIFSSIFNGGSWFGLPLYGGLFVAGLVLYLSILIYSFKKKEYHLLRRISLFYLFNFFFFLLLNAYSILPYFATLDTSMYSQVVNKGVIQAGFEWLNYISRGSSFLNLFKLQGIPDWYLSEFLPAAQHAYSGIYMSNFVLIFVSITLPVIGLLSLSLAKKREEKYLVTFMVFLLVISMFFAAGTNSPLGFIYNIFYREIPGFSIFRSPYFKFGYAYIISFTFLLAFSLSKGIEFINAKKVVIAISLIVFGWFSFHYVIFNPKKLFVWQTDKSTLIKIPSYVNDFDNWIKNQKDIDGRILLLPPLDNIWNADSYSWGYWSLSTLPSVTFSKASFIAGDVNLSGDERGWVNELYLLVEGGDIASFQTLASRLSVKEILLRKDFVSKDSQKYIDLVSALEKERQIELVKEFGEWSLFALTGVSEKPMVYTSVDFAKVSSNYFYLANKLTGMGYSNYSWFKFEDVSTDYNLDSLTKKEFYYLTCESCQIENLGKFAQLPPVRILPNSLFYQIKKASQKKSIDEAPDEITKLSVYLELSLTKLSEIKSMRSLDIDKRFILGALKDMFEYLAQIDALLKNSERMRNNFYVASKIYESLNPIQGYFRSEISSYDFQFEKEDIRDLIIKILWESSVIKKHFSPLISQSELWSHEKLYKLEGLAEGTYKLLVDEETLPVSSDGLLVKPQKLTTELGQEINFAKKSLFSKWYETDYFDKSKETQEIRFSFPESSNLYLSHGGQQLDFPEGTRGCLVGNISFFNKHKTYRLKLSSAVGHKSFRLYINEKKSDKEDFLRGDTVTDVFLAGQGYPFESIYVPNNSADDPTIYFCENDPGIPVNETVEVYEIFSPIVFAGRKVSEQSTDMPKVEFKEINPSRFKVSVTNVSGPFVLVFNQRFNSLWKLSDEKGQLVSSHFSVDGYANGWLLDGKKEYKLSLEYYPQRLFKYGIGISLSTLAGVVIICAVISFRKRNEESN